MIKSFKFKNFKNFKDEVNFTFERGNKIELSEHIIKKNGCELLPIKVIYGSNSVGKSNILTAFNFIRAIILNGNIRKNEDDYIGLCSNFDSKKDYETPMEFVISFLIKEDVYDYKISIKNHYKEKSSEITDEFLYINSEMIFERKGQEFEFSSKESIIKAYYQLFSTKKIKTEIQESLKANVLKTSNFMNWLQNYSSTLCQKIRNFFLNEVIIIEDLESEKINIPNKIKAELKKDETIENTYVNKLLKELDLTKQKIAFTKNEQTNEFDSLVKYEFNDSKEGILTRAAAVESKGTLKLIDLISQLVYSLKYGATLMIDELDSSIHHEIIYSIVSAYGDPTINKKGAQLVFTTHNPVYMNENLLRRDEIVFVEKNKRTSYINTLDDYKIRKDKKYLRNYLAGNFTILPNFDIGEIIKDDKN